MELYLAVTLGNYVMVAYEESWRASFDETSKGNVTVALADETVIVPQEQDYCNLLLQRYI
jgi:hypothetical protein